MFVVLLIACGENTPSSDPASAQTDAAPSSTSDAAPSAASSAPTVEGRVVVLSARDEKFMEPLWELLKTRHPKLELVVDYGKDAPYLDRMRAEKDAPRADLFLSKGSAAIAAASREGLLAPLDEALLARVPEPVRGAGGHWVGLSKRARIIVIKRDLADAPKTTAELADPRFAGRLARTVATNSSFVGGVTTAVADRGEEAATAWLAGLQSNTEDGTHVYPKHTPAVAAVMQGQAELALVNHYYFYRAVLGKEYDPALDAAAAQAKLDAAPIVVLFPADEAGVAWNVTGAGIVANGPNPAAAAAVLDVLLSAEGQRAFAWTNREYPVLDGVPAAPGVTPASDFTWSQTPLEKLAELQPKAVEMIQKAGLR